MIQEGREAQNGDGRNKIDRRCRKDHDYRPRLSIAMFPARDPDVPKKVAHKAEGRCFGNNQCHGQRNFKPHRHGHAPCRDGKHRLSGILK